LAIFFGFCAGGLRRLGASGWHDSYFSVRDALDIAEAALFTELMTFVLLFTLTRLDGIPRSMPLTHGLLLATGLIAARMVVRVVLSEDKEALDYHSHRSASF
jgi:FlaA1/EpsC-like NDP-sugar epimerase